MTTNQGKAGPMEASDQFGAGVEAPTNDPFAETSMEEFTQDDDPLAGVTEEPLTGADTIPVVDKEGNVVNDVEAASSEQDGEPTLQDEEALAEAERIREEEAASRATAEDPQSAPTDGEQIALSAGAEPDPTEAQDSPGTTPSETGDGEDPTQAVSPAQTPGSTNDSPTAAASPAAQDAAAPAASPASSSPSPASATEDAGPIDQPVSDPPPSSDTAPLPAEKKDAKGTVTHRRYVVLQPLGNGRHKEVSWFEDKGGKMVPEGTRGAKKQTVCLATRQEDALGIGYEALGAPREGVPLRAVALTYWGELTHVEPDPDPPIRQRLKFRR